MDFFVTLKKELNRSTIPLGCIKVSVKIFRVGKILDAGSGSFVSVLYVLYLLSLLELYSRRMLPYHIIRRTHNMTCAAHKDTKYHLC